MSILQSLPFLPGGLWETEASVQEHQRLLHTSAFGWKEVKDDLARTVHEFLAKAVAKYPGRIVVALDAKDGQVATEGWLDDSGVRAVDVANGMREMPIAALLYTDIARDGMEVGPNVPATVELATATGLPVIASGGVGTLDHLRELTAANHGILKGGALGITGAIVGRALHERRFSLEEAIAAAQGAA